MKTKTILISFLFLFAVTIVQTSFSIAAVVVPCDTPTCVTLAEDYNPTSLWCGKALCSNWGRFTQCVYQEDYQSNCTSEYCPTCCWAQNCELAPPPNQA